MKKYLKPVLKNLIILLVVFSVVEAFKTRNMLRDLNPTLEKYKKIPLLERGYFDLSKKSEKPKIIYFFAPWCPICKQVSSNFSVVKGEADIVGVALSWDSAQNVADFVSKYSDGSYPVVLGTNNLAADFKIESFPSFYFLDKDGNYSSSAASYVTSFGIWWRVQMAKIF